MALVIIKKIALASAMMVGGGYSSAVYYGLKDEDKRNFFSEHVPGYHAGLLLVSNAKHIGEHVFTRFFHSKRYVHDEDYKLLAANQLDKVNTIAELQNKHRNELDELRHRLTEKQEEHKTEITDQERLKKSIVAFQVEQETRFAERLEKALEVERQIGLEQQTKLLTHVDKLENRIEILHQKLEQHLYANDVAVDLDCISMLWNHNYCHFAKSKDFLINSLQLFHVRTKNTALEAIGSSLTRSAENSKATNTDFRIITDEFLRIRPIAEAYCTFDNFSLVSFFFPGFNRLLFRKMSDQAIMTQDHLSNIQESLNRRSLEQALHYANQLNGWPRVIFKEWIEQCRNVLEIEQGLRVSKYFLLAQRLAVKQQ